MVIKTIFSGSSLSSSSNEAFSLLDSSSFGEKKENKVMYTPIEALYLVKSKKMEVYKKNSLISFDKILSLIKKKDKDTEEKLSVFQDMRRKGFVLKSALKFGADFRVYSKGDKPIKSHSRWLLYISRHNNSIKWQDFSAKVRVANSTRKNLLLAILDDEDDVTYYEVSWKKIN